MRRDKFILRKGDIKAFAVSLFLAFIQTLSYNYFSGRPLFD